MRRHGMAKVVALHLGVIALLLALQFVLPPYHHTNAARIMVLATFAVGYNLLLGYTGLLSLGHAMFFAAGLYGAGMTVFYLGFGAIPAFGAGIAASLVGPLVGGHGLNVAHVPHDLVLVGDAGGAQDVAAEAGALHGDPTGVALGEGNVAVVECAGLLHAADAPGLQLALAVDRASVDGRSETADDRRGLARPDAGHGRRLL